MDMRTIVIGVITAAVAVVGVTLIKDRYFASAFVAICMLVAGRVASGENL